MLTCAEKYELTIADENSEYIFAPTPTPTPTLTPTPTPTTTTDTQTNEPKAEPEKAPMIAEPEKDTPDKVDKTDIINTTNTTDTTDASGDLGNWKMMTITFLGLLALSFVIFKYCATASAREDLLRGAYKLFSKFSGSQKATPPHSRGSPADFSSLPTKEYFS